jgi:flagellar hook-basal body complex protein FliE
MTVEPLVPDVAPVPRNPLEQKQSWDDAGMGFGEILNGLGQTFERAANSEDAFARGSGNLVEAVYERAQADVALSVATAAAQRAAQGLQTVLSMQV